MLLIWLLQIPFLHFSYIFRVRFAHNLPLNLKIIENRQLNSPNVVKKAEIAYVLQTLNYIHRIYTLKFHTYRNEMQSS